jgi:aryl-alcohol dehydrogenase-like predicted oxidoreductase
MAWLLAQPIVGCILVGARNVDQIKQNINANQIKLAEDVIQKLNEITKPLKQELGKNPDLWQSGEDTRYR